MSENSDETVLIVEDDEVTRVTLCGMVRKMGFQPALARNGIEGLRIFIATRDIRAVVLDLLMPHFDGYDFLKAVNAMYSTNVLSGPSRVIVHTSVSQYSDLRQFTNHPAVHAVLSKPASFEQLQHSINLCGTTHSGSEDDSKQTAPA